MKTLLFIFLVASGVDGINKIAEINKYKQAGNEAYSSADYETAAANYRYLFDTLKVKEDPIVLNLGHSYYQLKDTTNAKTFYGMLTASSNRKYRSIAHQQLGVISSDQKNYALALNHFKNSLKADPENKDARYNYELAKRLLQSQQKDQDQQGKGDQPEPSEFAKRLKQQADEMVRNNQFASAYSLMARGLEQDQTVSAYNDFIEKLKDVAEAEATK